MNNGLVWPFSKGYQRFVMNGRVAIALVCATLLAGCTRSSEQSSTGLVLGASDTPGNPIACETIETHLGFIPYLPADGEADCSVRATTAWVIFGGTQIEMQHRQVPMPPSSALNYAPPDELGRGLDHSGDAVTTTIRGFTEAILGWRSSGQPTTTVQWFESLGENTRLDVIVRFTDTNPAEAVAIINTLSR